MLHPDVPSLTKPLSLGLLPEASCRVCLQALLRRDSRDRVGAKGPRSHQGLAELVEKQGLPLFEPCSEEAACSPKAWPI